MNHAKVISELGGAQSVAEALACHVSRPYRWRHSGIPAERWPAVVDLATARGLSRINLDALAAGRRQSNRSTGRETP